MDDLKKWMIIRFTPYQNPTYQNGCSPNNFCSKTSCCKMVRAAFKHVPQTTATTFTYVFILVLWQYSTICTPVLVLTEVAVQKTAQPANSRYTLAELGSVSNNTSYFNSTRHRCLPSRVSIFPTRHHFLWTFTRRLTRIYWGDFFLVNQTLE